MGIRTDVEIQIEAPPERVFEFVTQRDKIALWAGDDPSYMPSANSELRSGYHGKGTVQAPDGPREVEFEITAFDPPTLFAYKATYAGGDAQSTYRLAANGSGTHLEVSSDTDYAKMAMPQQTEDQIEKLPSQTQAFWHHAVHEMAQQFESGALDDDPQVKAGMETALRGTLEKLKQLAESQS
jgi:uncharacterized protein YndB with AHSA1/START domain